MSDLIHTVSELIEEVCATIIVPLFHSAEKGVEEKSPGELVTRADREAEKFLTPALLSLLSGSRVIGEEAVSEDPSLLDSLNESGDIWLVDPLDGTSNFAAGLPSFATMIALLRQGETVASWICNPVANEMAVAERGSGSRLNGERIVTQPVVRGAEKMSGAILQRFFPSEINDRAEKAKSIFGNVSSGSKCAGSDYIEVVKGSLDFVLYWRTLPWDHAPGSLFLQEAGGYAARPDGSSYMASDYARDGLLIAQSKEVWEQVREAIFS